MDDIEGFSKIVSSTVNQEAKEKQIAEGIQKYDEINKTAKRKILEQVKECNMEIVENTNHIIALKAEEPVNMIRHCMEAIKAFKKRIKELEALLEALEQ